MSLSTRFKNRNKVLAATLATTAALAGGVGVAAAATGPSTPRPAAGSTAAQQAEGPEQNDATEQAEGPEQNDATEQAEGPEEAEQEPALNGSIQTKEVAGEGEQEEQARLTGQATVTKAQAEQAAVAAVPGTVAAAELGDEGGSLVWEVDVTKADGSSVEVLVDAGNSTVLAQEADDDTGEQDAGGQDVAGQGESSGTSTG